MLQPTQAAAVPNSRSSQARRGEDSVFPLFIGDGDKVELIAFRAALGNRGRLF